MKTADQIFEDKIKFIDAAEKRLKRAVGAYERKLFELLTSEYLPKFETVDGIVVNSPKNVALLNSMDSYFDKLLKVMYTDVLGQFARDLIKSTSLSAEYYIRLGFKKTVVNNLVKNKAAVEQLVGITATGKLRKNGYLYQLARTPKARQEIKDYVLKSLSGDTSFLDYQLGMRNLVLGNKRKKALSVNGRIAAYFDQYAHDTFADIDAAANSQIAKGLNLNHFLYANGLIKTSRKFCIKRAGKVFKVSDTKTWKDDPDLIDQKTKDSYKPLVERGRYRCRHYIKYITESLYNSLK